MKSFKQHITQPNVLSWEGSCFASMRKRGLKEEVRPPFNRTVHSETRYDGGHPDIMPKKLISEHEDSIKTYTNEDHDENGLYSAHINGNLRGVKSNIHAESDLAYHTETISSAFTKSNTNRIPITTFAGVPAHVGKSLMEGGAGKQHTLKAFTSSSFDPGIGHMFGQCHNDKSSSHIHVLKMHVSKGAGLSVGHLSNNLDEEEVILNHGSKITYHHTIEHRGDDASRNPQSKKPTMVHHITVHSPED